MDQVLLFSLSSSSWREKSFVALSFPLCYIVNVIVIAREHIYLRLLTADYAALHTISLKYPCLGRMSIEVGGNLGMEKGRRGWEFEGESRGFVLCGCVIIERRKWV